MQVYDEGLSSLDEFGYYLDYNRKNKKDLAEGETVYIVAGRSWNYDECEEETDELFSVEKREWSFYYDDEECALVIAGPGEIDGEGGMFCESDEIDPDSVEKIIIDDSVTSIEGPAMFSGLDYVTSIQFGNGLKTIGNEVFAYLPRLTAVNLGGSIESVEFGNAYAAFYREIIQDHSADQ